MVPLDITPDAPGTYVFTATCGASSKSFTLKVVHMKVEAKHKPSSNWSEASMYIAAGGRSSDVHKADVNVVFTPALDGSIPVKVSLQDGGEGYQPSAWWWRGTSRKRATLAMGGQSFVYGQTGQPLTFTPTAGLSGVVTSSNRREWTTVVVEVPSLGITKSISIHFVLGEFTVDLGEMPFPHNQWRTFTVSSTLDEIGVNGHELKYVVSRVVLANGQVLGPDVEDEEEDQESLVDYVELDQGAWFNNEYQEDTTDSNGQATGEFRVVNQNVVEFQITIFDMDVAK